MECFHTPGYQPYHVGGRTIFNDPFEERPFRAQYQGSSLPLYPRSKGKSTHLGSFKSNRA